MNNDRADELFEALTLERIFLKPQPPWMFWRGTFNQWWWGRPAPMPQDIAYFNANREYHRIYGPAYISVQYQIEEWYKNGIMHRENGPARTHKNNMWWFREGKLHRLDGPAIVAGGYPREYWINGQNLPPKEYKKEIARRKRKGLIK